MFFVAFVLISFCYGSYSLAIINDNNDKISSENGEICSPNFPVAVTGQLCSPIEYTCDDEEINPEITWSHVDSNGTTMSFVLMMDDLSFDYFLHWLVADMRSDTRVIPRALADNINATTHRRYIGPCSPFDMDNRYRITVYAMPTTTTPISIIGKKGDDLDAEFRRTALNAYSFVVTNYRNTINPPDEHVDCFDQNVPCL